MELISKKEAQTVYDIRLTEKELGTILVALGYADFDDIKNENRSYDSPYKIVGIPSELDKLTDELAELMD